MDCGEYQKDNRWLRNKVLVKVTEGNIYEGWFMVDYGESQKDNRLLRNRIVKKMTEGEKPHVDYFLSNTYLIIYYVQIDAAAACVEQAQETTDVIVFDSIQIRLRNVSRFTEGIQPPCCTRRPNSFHGSIFLCEIVARK